MENKYFIKWNAKDYEVSETENNQTNPKQKGYLLANHTIDLSNQIKMIIDGKYPFVICKQKGFNT